MLFVNDLHAKDIKKTTEKLEIGQRWDGPEFREMTGRHLRTEPRVVNDHLVICHFCEIIFDHKLERVFIHNNCLEFKYFGLNNGIRRACFILLLWCFIHICVQNIKNKIVKQ